MFFYACFKAFDSAIGTQPYNGPRRFAVNGGLFDKEEQIFKVSFAEWNEQYLLPEILIGKEYYLLIYPSQSGKTTRVFEFINQLKELKFMRGRSECMKKLQVMKLTECINETIYEKDIELLPLYVDMTKIIKATGNTLIELEKSLWNIFVEQLNPSLSRPIDSTKYFSFSTLFDNSSLHELFGGKYPVLFLDEIDALSSLDGRCDEIIKTMNTSEDKTRIRTAFLLDLRSVKHSPTTHCLQSVVGISNYMGDYTQIVRGSPFNVNNLLYGSYFTREQFEKLVLQYEGQENIKIDKDILDDMYERTLGHPGQTIILLIAYHENRPQLNEKNSTLLQQWLQFISSDYFRRRLG